MADARLGDGRRGSSEGVGAGLDELSLGGGWVARSTARSSAFAACFSLPRSVGAALFVLESMAALYYALEADSSGWRSQTNCSQDGAGCRALAVAGCALSRRTSSQSCDPTHAL